MPDGIGKTGHRNVSLVLAGGVGLGAYEAGAYSVLHDDPALRPEWLAGSSIGGVTAAIIAGNPPERRIERLRQFWARVAQPTPPIPTFWMDMLTVGPWREALNEKNALDTLVFGRPGLFHPRLAPGTTIGAPDVRTLYDLAPLRTTLAELVDFELLNQGDVRLSLSCTDVLSGERVVFDTARGDRVGVDHVLASCALLPLFAPIELEGRLLADGCLGANTPLDLVLDDNPDRDMLCFVVELFARQGSRPHTLGASAARAGDLAFGNQTRRILEGREREYRLRSMIGALAQHLPPEIRDDPRVAAILAEGRTSNTVVATVAYRAGLDEAGPLKPFDFSAATLADRWNAGAAAMQEAVGSVTASADEGRPALSVIGE